MDVHQWNTLDRYRFINETRLSQHPFVTEYRDALEIKEELPGVMKLRGHVFCQNEVVLFVRKEFDLRYSGGIPRIRGRIYSYVGWVPGRHLLLKYHNLHADPEEYHHRIYDPNTGREIAYEVLQRYQFPVFSEALDELQILSAGLPPHP